MLIPTEPPLLARIQSVPHVLPTVLCVHTDQPAQAVRERTEHAARPVTLGDALEEWGAYNTGCDVSESDYWVALCKGLEWTVL